MWEGCAGGKPKGSGLWVDVSLLPAPCGCCANKQPAYLGAFHEATEFTGEKRTLGWQLQLNLRVAELFVLGR